MIEHAHLFSGQKFLYSNCPVNRCIVLKKKPTAPQPVLSTRAGHGESSSTGVPEHSNSSATILTVAQRSSCIRSVTFAMSPSLRTENGRPGLTSSSIVSTPLFIRAYHLDICARDKQLSPYTSLIISTVSAAVFPSLKHNLMFVLCSMPLL